MDWQDFAGGQPGLGSVLCCCTWLLLLLLQLLAVVLSLKLGREYQAGGSFRESFVILRPTDQPRLAHAAQRDPEGSRIAPHQARQWTFDIEPLTSGYYCTRADGLESRKLAAQASPLVLHVQRNQSVGTGVGGGRCTSRWHQRPCRNRLGRFGCRGRFGERGPLCMAQRCSCHAGGTTWYGARHRQQKRKRQKLLLAARRQMTTTASGLAAGELISGRSGVNLGDCPCPPALLASFPSFRVASFPADVLLLPSFLPSLSSSPQALQAGWQTT